MGARSKLMRALRWIGAALAAVLLAACITVVIPELPPDDDTRPLYQIEVTAPGTRSQGWRGVLYDRNGAAIALAPGARVETPAGRFVGVACPHAWSTCGAIEENMLRWMERHEHNIIMGRERWVYRINARGYYGDRLEGVLLREGVRVEAGREARTPMGTYRWVDGRPDAPISGRHGWWHEGWGR
jgi:hypothetical protein